MSLLQVRNLHKRYGDFVALHDVSFEVDRGEVLGFLGPNGAGKTTVFNLISRLYTPSSGYIEYGGVNLNEIPPHGIAAAGIART